MYLSATDAAYAHTLLASNDPFVMLYFFPPIIYYTLHIYIHVYVYSTLGIIVYYFGKNSSKRERDNRDAASKAIESAKPFEDQGRKKKTKIKWEKMIHYLFICFLLIFDRFRPRENWKILNFLKISLNHTVRYVAVYVSISPEQFFIYRVYVIVRTRSGETKKQLFILNKILPPQ